MKPKKSAKEKKNIKGIGSRKVKERKWNCWTEDDIQEALRKLKSVPRSKIRTVTSVYGVNEFTIRFRLKTNKLTAKDKKKKKKTGQNCVFSAEAEAQLANLIAVVCNHGFSPTFREIIDLVEPHVKMNKLETVILKMDHDQDRHGWKTSWNEIDYR